MEKCPDLLTHVWWWSTLESLAFLFILEKSVLQTFAPDEKQHYLWTLVTIAFRRSSGILEVLLLQSSSLGVDQKVGAGWNRCAHEADMGTAGEVCWPSGTHQFHFLCLSKLVSICLKELRTVLDSIPCPFGPRNISCCWYTVVERHTNLWHRYTNEVIIKILYFIL